MIYFRKNLLYLRTNKSMTLKQITGELGFSGPQWNNYELGLSYPKFLDLIKISQYFNISESDLIHKDLALNQAINSSQKKNYKEIINLQSKLIRIQEEKIKKLEIKIQHLIKNTSLND